MIIYPAIDLLDGEVVRLHKGDFGAVSRYGCDPVSVANSYRDAGAEWVHVVDLSGARDGRSGQADAIAAICATGLQVQSGGGIRNRADLERLFDRGVARAVIGSLALTAPDEVTRWLAEFGPSRVTLAFDVKARGGEFYPAINGWQMETTDPLESALRRYEAVGLAHALVTDIDRDGVLGGINLGLYRRLAQTFPAIGFQASGGVATLADFDQCRELGLSGIVTGKALYEGRIDLGEALRCSQNV
jgi:phosphoribosylformimino-5-aminoimidazole carboxamide ribotide isomerase